MKPPARLQLATMIATKSFRLSFVVVMALLLATSARATTNVVAARQPGTLAFHLATNAAARVAQFNASPEHMVEIYAPFTLRFDRFFAPSWSHDCWLRGVQGLSATCIGFSNSTSGQGLVTMVSPRHYLCATHMHPEFSRLGFLDVNNRLHWRRTLERVDVANDTSVGLLEDELPPAVGFLPVLPADYTNYLPTAYGSFVQGIGMNQDMYLFSQPTCFGDWNFVNWDSHAAVPFGLTTNWNVTVRGGDSSNPARLLIGNQLVLITHNFHVNGGPSYARQIPRINQTMHLLSTNHFLHSDYQLTEFPLTNWPSFK